MFYGQRRQVSFYDQEPTGLSFSHHLVQNLSVPFVGIQNEDGERAVSP